MNPGAIFMSWRRVFAAAAITVLLADVVDGGLTGVDWEAVAVAGCVAVGPVVLNWLNPNDPRYGRYTPGDPGEGVGDPALAGGAAE